MDYDKAITILGLSERFSQLDLIRQYQKNVTDVSRFLAEETEPDFIASIAERINDITTAYMLLRNSGMDLFEDSDHCQPLIIFTDASVMEDKETAAFGIVVENISNDFDLPKSILDRYNIHFESGYSDDLCVLSGEVVNYTVDSAEIMGIIAATEIFMFLVQHSSQTMVIYTDSLMAKKVLTDNRMPANTKIYSQLRHRFNKLVNANYLDIIIKKVQAHSGIEYNEIADQVAKERNNIILPKYHYE